MPGPWEKYQAESADSGPWSKYDKSENPKAESIDPNAALSGAGQALTLGYLPQLQAGAEQITNKGLGLLGVGPEAVNKDLEAKGFKINEPSGYVASRDQNIAKIEQQTKESPVSYYGGMIGGSIASAPLMAGAAAKLPLVGGMAAAKPGLIGRTAQAVAGGAGAGLLQNPGDTQGEISLLQPEARLENAKMGAMIGGAAQLGGEAIKSGAKAVFSAPKAIKEWSQNTAFKSAGAMLKDFRAAGNQNKVPQLGQEMIDSGLAQPGMTFKDVAEKSSAIKEQVGKRIGEIYDTVAANVNPARTPEVLAKELQDELLQAAVQARPKLSPAAYEGKMVDVISEITADPSKVLDVRHLHDMMAALDQKIQYAKRAIDLPETEQGYLALRRHLRATLDKVTEQVGANIGSPELKTELLSLNKKYGNLSTISQVSKDRVSRESANRMFGLSEQFGVLGGGLLGAQRGESFEDRAKNAAMGAAAGFAVNKLGKGYALPVAVTGANKLASGVQSLAGPTAKSLLSGAEQYTSRPVGIGAAAQSLLNQPKNKKAK